MKRTLAIAVIALAALTSTAQAAKSYACDKLVIINSMTPDEKVIEHTDNRPVIVTFDGQQFAARDDAKGLTMASPVMHLDGQGSLYGSMTNRTSTGRELVEYSASPDMLYFGMKGTISRIAVLFGNCAPL